MILYKNPDKIKNQPCIRVVSNFCVFLHMKHSICIFFAICTLQGYGGENPDSLALTREFLKTGDIRKAGHTISPYYKDHPDDFNTIWLYAYTSYFTKNYSRSVHLYKKAIVMSPDNYYLKLDYARFLVNIGDYNKARPILNDYLGYDPTNSLAIFCLADLRFYQADYRGALSSLDKISPQSEEYQDGVILRKTVNLYRAPWISAGMGFATDDQPMQGYFPEIKAGWSLHPLATLSLDLRAPVFQKSGLTYYSFWGEAGNKFYFARPSIGLGIKFGAIKFPEKNSLTLTGSIVLSKTFVRNLEVKLLAERAPYFSTISSIDSSVIENHAAFSLGWNDINSWNGVVTAEARRYPIDNNTLFSLNGWIMAPPARFSVFEFRFGLGYNYSNARKNDFVSEKSLAEILQNWDPSTAIKGIYNPYFTPRNQQVGSVIISVGIHPGKLFDIDLNANLGVYSTAMIPYLYLDKNSSGNIFINKGFVREYYFPATVNASLGFKPTGNLRLQVDYNFSSTYYFIRHYAGLTVKINLTHAGKN